MGQNGEFLGWLGMDFGHYTNHTTFWKPKSSILSGLAPTHPGGYAHLLLVFGSPGGLPTPTLTPP